MKTELALQAAGIVQILLLTAGATMSRVVDMRRHVATLPPFLGHLFWTYFGFIGLVLLSFGTITLANAAELAGGGHLARWFNGALCLFWLARLGVQFFVFDLSPYITNDWLRAGYVALNIVFVLLPAVYGWAALAGARPL